MDRSPTLVLSLIIAIAAAGPARAGALHPNPDGPDKWEPWLEFGGYGASDNRSRGEANVFLPLWQNASSMFFFQGKGKFFEADVQEGNLALGFRQVREDLGFSPGGQDLGGWNLGGWMGWDIRHTDEENTFHQFALGIEALSPVFDLRLNGYVPATDPKGSPGLASAKVSGGSIVMIGGEEVPLHGFDGEVGVRLLGGSIMDREQALRVYAGGFYFDDDEAADDVSGPRVRAEWRVHDVIPGLPGSQLAFEMQFQHDDLRDSQWEGGLRVRIPFGAARTARADLTPQERRMTASIVRDTDIVTGPSEPEPVENAHTNVPLLHVARADGGDDLQTVIDDAGPKSLILVHGDNGTVTGGVTVGPERTIQGGSSTILVRGLDSNTSVRFRAPGSKPTIEYTNNGEVFRLSSHTHLAGLGIVGAGMGSGFSSNHGTFALSDTMNVALTDNMIMEVGGEGISFDSNASWLWIDRNMLSDIGDLGIEIDSSAEHVWVRHNSIMNTGSNGIDFDSSSDDLWVNYNVLTDIGSRAIDFDSNSDNITAIYNILTNISGSGFDFGSNSDNLMVSYNVLENISGVGIDFSGDSDNIRASYNTLTDIGAQAFDFSSGSDDIWAIGNVIENTGGNGFLFSGTTTNTTVSRNRLTEIGGRGINIGNVTNGTIADNTVIDAASHYIEVNSNSTVTVTGNVLRDDGDGGDGMHFDANITGTVAGNRWEGDFGDDIIDLDGGGNALTGGANVLDATFGHQFCEDDGANGASRIGFTNGTFCP